MRFRIDASHFRNLRHHAATAGQAGNLHDQVDGRGNLAVDRKHRQIGGHQHQHLHAFDHFLGTVGVDRGEAAVVAGVHRLEHVEGFAATALADNNPVGPHPQGVANQVANRVLARALHVGQFRFQADHVLLMQPQFLGILDRNNPLLVGNEAAQHVQQRSLTSAGTAADQNVAVVDHGRPQESRRRLGDTAQLEQVVHRHPLDGELADGKARPPGGQGRNDRVDTRTIGQPRIDQRSAFVDPPPHLGHDPFDDAFGNLLRNEAAARTLDHAAPLDVNLVALHDHDFRDGGCPQQVLQGPEPKDGVFEVFLQGAQQDVLAQLGVQVNPHGPGHFGKPLLQEVNLLADIRNAVQVQLLANVLQQVVEFGFALGHQRGRHVELVGGDARQIEVPLVAGFHDELVDEQIAEREHRQLIEQRFIVLAEHFQFAAHILDVVLQQQDVVAVMDAVVLQFVEIEPLQQHLVNAQLQRSQHAAKVGFHLLGRNGGLHLGLERQRVRPDTQLDARRKLGFLAAQQFAVAHQAAIQPHVLDRQLPIAPANDGMPPGDQRAAQDNVVFGVAADGDFRRLGFE